MLLRNSPALERLQFEARRDHYEKRRLEEYMRQARQKIGGYSVAQLREAAKLIDQDGPLRIMAMEAKWELERRGLKPSS
jgi:hypothetical protein